MRKKDQKAIWYSVFGLVIVWAIVMWLTKKPMFNIVNIVGGLIGGGIGYFVAKNT